MVDINDLERQLADESLRIVGPEPVVDDAAIFTTITATQSPKWRFQSMFNATKFVVAGAIVALFGGLLFGGVLTPPSDVQVPAVGASASAQAEPTAVTTAEPEPTAVVEADNTTATRDLLPGVDLVTEEIEPGVYRVLSDGAHGLRQNVSDVAVSPEGDVWVVKSRTRSFRLGIPRASDIKGEDIHLVAASDGAIVLVDPARRPPDQQRRMVLDGKRWVRWAPTREQGCEGAWTDGACWTIDSGSVKDPEPTLRVIRSDRTGAQRSFSEAEIGIGPDEGLSAIVASDDGTVWLEVFARNTEAGWERAGFIGFDGETWSRVPPPTRMEFNPQRDISVDAEGVVWVASVSDGRLVLERWDGEAWSSFETSDYRFAPTYHVGADGSGGRGCCGPRLRFAEDGTLWLGGLTAFDGTSFTTVELPASGTSQEPRVLADELAPDGSVWVVLGEDTDDRGTTPAYDGLYVITPEAVAGAE